MTTPHLLLHSPTAGYFTVPASAVATSIDAFLSERTIRDEAASVPTNDMHTSYFAWCLDAGQPPLGIVAFGLELQRRGMRTGIDVHLPETKRTAEDARKRRVLDLRAWQGVKLLDGADLEGRP